MLRISKIAVQRRPPRGGLVAKLLGASLAVLLATPALAAEPAKLSFNAPKTVEKGRGFGGDQGDKPAGKRGGREDRSSDRDRKYARDLLTKYDADGDRVLEESEWKKISGSPEKADTNGDKRITFDELVNRVTSKRREKEVTKSAGKAKDRKSYRLTTAEEKLPEGLPSWFAQRDRNGDGQIAMHEYSSRWTDSTARRFVQMDTNDDGLITADEAR